MSSKRTRAVGASGAMVGALLIVLPAVAQQAEGQLEEIIVTAQKRSESIQDVPMSITAFTGEDLQRSGALQFRDYAVRVPNLAFGYTNSLSANAQSVALRGVFGANTTGVYIDDTPLPGSIDPSLVDLQRVEVLRGPQGTLYGARSMGGTLRLITRQPDVEKLDGEAHASLDQMDSGGSTGALDGTLNLPIVDGSLALRMSGFYREDGGVYNRVASPDALVDYGVNENVDGYTQVGGRASLRWEGLDGALDITPRISYEEIDTDGRPYADYEAGNREQTRLFNQDEKGESTWNLYTLTAHYRASFGDFTSATSRSERDFRDSEDFSELAELLIAPIPVPAVMRAHGTQDSTAEEFRFASRLQGPTQFTAGIFYQKQENTTVFPPTPVSPYFDNIFSQNLLTEVTELAVFGEINYAITDQITLTAGARWFDNEVDFEGSQDGALVAPDTFQGTQTETGVNPKFSIEYQLNDGVNLYATAAKGFRIGGVNSFSNLLCAGDLENLGLTAANAQTYDSDSLWSYEIGAKTSWLERRVTFNTAAFYIDWSDVQQQVALPTCGFFLTVNAGTARNQGFEFEIAAAATNNLTLNLAAGYTDAVITDGGQLQTIEPDTRVQHVPKWTGSVGIDYDFAIASLPMFARADYSYVDESYSANNDAVNPRVRPSYEIANARVGATLGSFEVALFVDNLFDETANLSDVPPLAIEYPGRPRIMVNRPRSIGIDARVRF